MGKEGEGVKEGEIDKSVTHFGISLPEGGGGR